MKIPLKYSGKTIYVEPYNTVQEKELLLFNEVAGKPDIDGVMDILKNNISGDIENLTHNEKIAVLYKLRSLSIGEEINIKFPCKECKAPNECGLNISEIVVPGIDTYEIKDQFKEVTEDNLQEFVDVDVDELDLQEFDDLMLKVKQNVTSFSLLKESTCMVCNHVHHFDISGDEYVVNSLSEDTIMSLYQTTADLVFFGKYTKLDVDSMLPFERTLFVGLLNKTREEMNK